MTINWDNNPNSDPTFIIIAFLSMSDAKRTDWLIGCILFDMDII